MNLPAALNLVEPLDRQTLGERAYAKLADLLISGRLAPGEKLSLRAAADVLGVSIMPVREAVSRLVADKALEVTPNRAVRVPPMSAAQFRDLTKVRIAIEGHAAARSFGIYTRYRAPTGLMALDRPVRYVLEAAATRFLGDLDGVLGFKSVATFGAGLELDASARDTFVTRTRVLLRYHVGNNVNGASLGIGMTF